MLPANYSLKVWAGATFTKHIQLLGANGQAEDLSGYTGLLTVRSAVGQPITYQTALTLGGTFGTVDLTIPSTATSGFVPGTSSVYELDITSSSNVVTALLTGSFIVQGIV